MKQVEFSLLRSLNKLKLSPNVSYHRNGASLFLFGESCILEFGRDVEKITAVLEMLADGAGISDLLTQLNGHDLHQLINQLIKLNWLHTHNSDCEQISPRYRQVINYLSDSAINPVACFNRLQSKKVAVVGVGGVGTQILEHLLGFGIQSFVLIDPDRIEQSNLNRQYSFSAKDIGKAKVDVAFEKLVEHLPQSQVNKESIFIESIEDLAILDKYQPDIIVNCADKPPQINKIMSSYADKRGIAFITGGVGVSKGYWGPLAPLGTARKLDRSEHLIINGHTLSKIECSSSHGPYNSILSALMADDIFVYLTGCGTPKCSNRYMGIDFKTMRVTPLEPYAK